MQRTTPAFSADVVGSLLRPADVKEARRQVQSGAMTPAQLRQIEDKAIYRCVDTQCKCGLKVVTDGEFRRAWWHFDFFEGLKGVEGYNASEGIQFTGVQTNTHSVRVVGKLGFDEKHPMLEDFKYLKSITAADVVPKMTIPSPSVLHFRSGRKGISQEAYPEMSVFFDDLAQVYKQIIRAFYDAGCRYLQLDDTVWGYLCSDAQRAQVRERGDDPDELAKTYARVLNTALEAKPEDMVISMHVCRGNFRSTWISEGGYEPVAEVLFGGVNIDAFFLEYDSERAGGFEPLRFIKPGKQQVVLGLVTTKTGQLENAEDVKARIREAAEYVSLDQLCLSTQCGFASTEEGNTITEDEQKAKLDLVVKIAQDVWGK